MGAALLALKGISSQIQANYELEEERRRGSLAAANTVLPLALSDIVLVCRHNIRRHFEADELGLGSTNIKLNDVATISEETISILKECVQYADFDARSRLTNIIRTYQLLLSRTERGYERKLQSNTDAQINYNQVIEVINWASLYGLAEDDFDYARDRSHLIPKELSFCGVYNALNLSGVSIDDYPLIGKIIEERRDGLGFDIMARS